MAEFPIPGVYSKIDASAAIRTLSPNDQVIGIVAKGTTEDTELVNKAYAPYSFNDAIEKYGKDSNIVKLMDVASDNGGKRFIIVRVDDKTTPETVDYQTALEVLSLEEAIDIVLFDSTETVDFKHLKNHCEEASKDRKERISIIGFKEGTTPDAQATVVEELNSAYVYTFHPNVVDVNGNELSGIYGAAALAGQIAAESDPSMPMTNVEINGFFGLAKKLKDSELEYLIERGIIPLEVRNGSIRIVRAISTYTKNASGEADITWQELVTVRISNYIFQDLRARLTRKFARAKQNQRTRDAIKSEVLTALLQYQEQEYIENVTPNDVVVEINPFDPFRNDVDFKYDVTGPLNVIFLTGHLLI